MSAQEKVFRRAFKWSVVAIIAVAGATIALLQSSVRSLQ